MVGSLLMTLMLKMEMEIDALPTANIIYLVPQTEVTYCHYVADYSVSV